MNDTPDTPQTEGPRECIIHWNGLSRQGEYVVGHNWPELEPDIVTIGVPFIERSAYAKACEERDRANAQNIRLREMSELETVKTLRADNAALTERNRQLEEALSYLPKIPTEPYEKELAKQYHLLQRKYDLLKGDRDKWLALDDCYYWTPKAQAERDQLRAENDRLKEVFSYLPKIPTEPYQKALAREITQLRQSLREACGALEFYSAMRFNREIMEWMPGGPDTARSILATLRARHKDLREDEQ